jgi:hypothetical protein
MGGTIRLNKGRFLCTFLVSFALLLVAWQRTDAAHWYTRGLLAGAALVGPALHGWVLETGRDGAANPTWVQGDRHVRASVQFDALAVGLVPVLALLLATPAPNLCRRAVLLASGAALYFSVDILIVALFPLLVFYKNPFTDVLGTFLGLITFVGAPVIIWFALTFRQLQQSWRPLR